MTLELRFKNNLRFVFFFYKVFEIKVYLEKVKLLFYCEWILR